MKPVRQPGDDGARVEGSEVAQEGVVEGDLAVGEAGGCVWCYCGGGGGGGGGVVED